jgi:hypothetical protein
MDLITMLLLGVLAIPADQSSGQTALQSDPNGWIDLLADKDLKNWTRVPLGAVGKLPAGQAGDPSPWKVDASGGTLVCEGDKAGHEMLRYASELGNFILHVEWRFAKLEGEPAYNSGVYVRTGADGTPWFQAQTGAAGGYLFGSAPVKGTMGSVNLRDSMTENRVRPAGEWNVYEIRAVGSTISLWVNGAVVNEYTECEVPRGFVGLEVEGYRIEFRNMKLKRLD